MNLEYTPFFRGKTNYFAVSTLFFSSTLALARRRDEQTTVCALERTLMEPGNEC